MRIHYIIILLLLSQFSRAQNGIKDIAVIQNKTGFLTGKLKSVQEVFRGKYSRWPANNLQTTIVLPSSKNPSASTVAAVIYNSSVKEMQKFWLSIVFQGRANPPVFLDTDAEIIQYVLKNPGAIGVVSSEYRKTAEDKYFFLFLE